MQSKINRSTLHSIDWSAQACLAFTTTRVHPLKDPSAAIEDHYGGFNLALHVGDNTQRVLDNRALLQKFLPEGCQLQWLTQVHGATVITVTKVTAQAITADAQITRERHIALAIMTADCLPILLAAADGSEVAAIHGGWRSLSQQIIANTIQAMTTPANKLVAWLGPCIGQLAFEVNDEIKAIFVAQNPALLAAFMPSKAGHCLASLPFIAQQQLQQCGVANINALSHCTFSQYHQYYSYRRESVTGRMATIICRA